MKVMIVMGTRPEVIKFAPIVRSLEQSKVTETIIVHTGQHYEYLMWRAFLEELNLSTPNYSLNIKDKSSIGRLSQMISNLEDIMNNETPDVVLVLGDTDSALAGAIVARRLLIPLAHIEAGLRSFNIRSPEELNRRIIAQCATIHFAPTNLARFFLIREGIPKDRIFVVGNTIVDILAHMLPEIASKIKPQRDMILTTIHRPENVDIEENLVYITNVLLLLARRYRVVFPIHPRTRERLKKKHLMEVLSQNPNILITEPKRYSEFLKLLCNSALIITDSGGVQEEAVTLRKRVLILRPTTPRWEVVLTEMAYLVNLNIELILSLVDKLLEGYKHEPNVSICKVVNHLFGDGYASERIVKILAELYRNGKLVYNSPDFSGKGRGIVEQFLRSYLGVVLDESSKDKGSIL